MEHFEEIEHTADWAFRIRGRTLAELFLNAARAVCWPRGAAPQFEPSVMREVSVEGVDRETLLVNWLNELLYLQETKGEAYNRFEITEISETSLRARVEGRTREASDANPIKAVTFHDLRITEEKDGFEVTVVVDV
ncbi:MAG TPA: archease [Terriglobales bacterium]|nr:archease [Terriglobales bacterium]